MENDKPLLEEATFKFSQEAHCLSDEDETIEISLLSSLGVDRDQPLNHFFVIKTDSWAVDRIEDLQSLFVRIERILNKND